MGWNHRILAHENNGEVYFQLHEVYYKDEVPDSYTANPITVGSESLKGIKYGVFGKFRKNSEYCRKSWKFN